MLPFIFSGDSSAVFENIDVWFYIMDCLPIIQDINTISKVCKTSHDACRMILSEEKKMSHNFNVKPDLLCDLIGKRLFRRSDGFLTTSNKYSVLFQAGLCPLIVKNVSQVHLDSSKHCLVVDVEIHPDTRYEMDTLTKFWRLPDIPNTFAFSFGDCKIFGGTLQKNDWILCIIELSSKWKQPLSFTKWEMKSICRVMPKKS